MAKRLRRRSITTALVAVTLVGAIGAGRFGGVHAVIVSSSTTVMSHPVCRIRPDPHIARVGRFRPGRRRARVGRFRPDPRRGGVGPFPPEDPARGRVGRFRPELSARGRVGLFRQEDPARTPAARTTAFTLRTAAGQVSPIRIRSVPPIDLPYSARS